MCDDPYTIVLAREFSEENDPACDIPDDIGPSDWKGAVCIAERLKAALASEADT